MQRCTPFIVLLTSLLFACSKAPERPAGATGQAGTTPEVTEKIKLGVIAKGTIHEFWLAVKAGAEAACAEQGVDMLWDGPSTETRHDEQRRILENMVSAGVKGIVIAPTSHEALVRPVESAVAGGVPVVVFDSNLDGESYISFVATDNKAGGKLAGKAIIERTGGTPQRLLMLRYTEGSGSTRAREAGFEEAVAETPGARLLESQFTSGTTEGAIDVATNMLNRYVVDGKLEVDGMFAANLPTTIGMMRALDRLAKQGVTVNVVAMGFDSSEELINGLKDDKIQGLIVQDPYGMGYTGVQTMLSYLRGEDVPRYIDTGVTLVTRPELDKPEIRKLLGLKD